MPCGLMHHASLAETDQGTAVGLECSRPSLCSCVLHSSNTITCPSAWCCWPPPAAVGQRICFMNACGAGFFLPLQCTLPQAWRCSFHVKHSSTNSGRVPGRLPHQPCPTECAQRAHTRSRMHCWGGAGWHVQTAVLVRVVHSRLALNDVGIAQTETHWPMRSASGSGTG